jgi:DNA modification methylase
MVNAAISAKNIAGSRKVHQWEKPIEGLYDVLIGATARPYTYFFSPFAGSGNSMVAAAKYHMRPCGADINAPHYLSTFKLRMHNLMEQSNDNQDNQASDEDSGSV